MNSTLYDLDAFLSSDKTILRICFPTSEGKIYDMFTIKVLLLLFIKLGMFKTYRTIESFALMSVMLGSIIS